MLTDKHQLSTTDCVAVLEKARKDFLAVMDKLSSCPNTLDTDGRRLVVYYLSAVVILRHLQRPDVVEHMTVSVSNILVWIGKFTSDILVIMLLINVISLSFTGQGMAVQEKMWVPLRHWCEGAQDSSPESGFVCPVGGGGACKCMAFPAWTRQTNIYAGAESNAIYE